MSLLLSILHLSSNFYGLTHRHGYGTKGQRPAPAASHKKSEKTGSDEFDSGRLVMDVGGGVSPLATTRL